MTTRNPYNVRMQRGGGQIVIVDDDNPGNRTCQVCATDDQVLFVRFCGPRAAYDTHDRAPRVVYVRVCRACWLDTARMSLNPQEATP